MKSLAYVVVSTIVVAACGPPAPVTVTELERNVPNPPPSSGALGVSDSGRIVGYYGDHAAEYENGAGAAAMPIPPGYGSCQAIAVTIDGRIAGTCKRGRQGEVPTSQTPYRRTAVFAASAQSPFQLITPGDEVESVALDMNERGVLLGVSNTAGMADHAPWIYDTNAGTLTVLPGLRNARMSASAINDAGDIVGEASMPASNGGGSVQPLLWSGDDLTITTLQLPPGDIEQITVADINNRGAIVGGARDNAFPDVRLVFWSSASAAPEILPHPVVQTGFSLYHPSLCGLNDDGLIVGTAQYSAFSDLFTPMAIAWTPDRRVIQLADRVQAEAVNAAGVIVGSRDGRAVRLDWPAE